MEEKKQKKPNPGGPGYKGGEFMMTMVVDGKAKNVRVRKDKDGNIVYMGVSDKIWGLF